jgi:penicillin-insensitive murein DD-endopeptidase
MHRAAILLPAFLASTIAGSAMPQAATPDKRAVAPAANSAKPSRPAPVAAKRLFGAATSAAPLAARAIGFYSRGCLAGARPLPVDGPTWQAMRLSRNRNWGHPSLIRFVERFAQDVRRLDGWPGLLVGDLSQPRGGPMLTGHASHQIGLDADIWLTPMPERRLSAREREEVAATSMLATDKVSVDPAVWTSAHVKLIKRATTYPEVERVFVHPAIKKALCQAAGTAVPERAWLGKVRPIWGHYYHFHVRLACPKDSPNCRRQETAPGEDGCGKELQHWLALLIAPPRPSKPAPPAPPLTLDQLPHECKGVLTEAAATPARKRGAAEKTAAPSGLLAPLLRAVQH